MGPNVKKNAHFGLFGGGGGPGWPINNRTWPILLPRHPLTYINLHIKWKQFDKDFLSYRENGGYNN